MNSELEDEIKLIITPEDEQTYKRLDHFLAQKIPDLSRSFIKGLYEREMISSEGNLKLSLKKMPPAGVEVNIQIPPPLPSEAKAENIPLEILFEDEHIVIVNKPAGLVTHPAPGNYTGTLVNAVLYHCPDLKGVGDQKRPGIVHRLDKGTSGVMVVAKTHKAHENLIIQFSTHSIERRYEALAMSKNIPVGGKLECIIGRHPNNRLKMAANVTKGKNAITNFKVLTQFEKMAHMELKLETGRTHQIRVHLGSLLHAPILCDPLYGNPKEHLKRLGPDYEKIIQDYPHPFLHAKVLGLEHPITKEQLRFEVPPPAIFQDVLELARKDHD